jgi:hypothetical protein
MSNDWWGLEGGHHRRILNGGVALDAAWNGAGWLAGVEGKYAPRQFVNLEQAAAFAEKLAHERLSSAIRHLEGRNA